MKKEPKAQEKKIKEAYDALATLLKKGEAPTKSAINRLTGISRETLNSKLPEWIDFNKALKGESTARLLEAKVDASESQRWQRELQGLLERIRRGEEVLGVLQKFSECSFQKLLDQLHQYFVLAQSTPKQLQEEADLRKDHESILLRLHNAEAIIRKWSTEQALPNNVRHLASKVPINVISHESRRLDLDEGVLLEQYVDAVNKLDDIFRGKDESAPSVVYVMCGLPAAGKSRWIESHSSPFGGINVYLDGTSHTKTMRMMLVKRVRILGPTCQVICCRVRSDLEACLRANAGAERKRTGLTMKESVIRRIAAAFEEVTVNEDFDSIILISP